MMIFISVIISAILGYSMTACFIQGNLLFGFFFLFLLLIWIYLLGIL